MASARIHGPAQTLAAEAALLDPESHEYWALVHELQRRGDQETFDAAAGAASSGDGPTRILGLHVLAQLGFEVGRPFLEGSLPLAILAAGAQDAATVLAAVNALGHLRDQRGLAPVVVHCAHLDRDIRHAAAMALPAVAGDPPAEEAVDHLVGLTSDPDSDVRDWATFGLGSLLEVDSPAVRDALAARIDDPEGDISGEALVGLAVRGDQRAAGPLLHLLQDPRCGNLIVEAAAALASPALLPALRRLKEFGWDPDNSPGGLLDQALKACTERD